MCVCARALRLNGFLFPYYSNNKCHRLLWSLYTHGRDMTKVTLLMVS